MVDAYYDGQAGGFGDAIIVRESRAQRDGLFGGLVAIFVLAFARGMRRSADLGRPDRGHHLHVRCHRDPGLRVDRDHPAPVQAGDLHGPRSATCPEVTTGWSCPGRLPVTGLANTGRTFCGRKSAERLRIVPLGSGRSSGPGLALDGSDQVLPLGLFSVREVRRACQSKGWEFAALPRASAYSGGRRVKRRVVMDMVPGAWSAVTSLLVGLWQAAGHFLAISPGLAVTALAMALLVGAIAACLVGAAWLGRRSAAIPLTGLVSALREKSWRAGIPAPARSGRGGHGPAPEHPRRPRRPPEHVSLVGDRLQHSSVSSTRWRGLLSCRPCLASRSTPPTTSSRR